MNDHAEVLAFSDRQEFRKWLLDNHASANSIWIEFTKGYKGFTANDALEEAICFGWIDGVMKSIDETRYKKYFAQRKDVHKWSEKNKAIYGKMVESHAMTPSGVAVYLPEANDDRTALTMDEKIQELRNILRSLPEVLRLFDDKPPSRQKQLAGFYCEAKTVETRSKRKRKIVDALVKNYSGMLY